MVKTNAYSWPSAFMDSQSWIKNTVFYPWSVESADAKPRNTEGSHYTYRKISAYKWISAVVQRSIAVSFESRLELIIIKK